jgi:flagellin
MALTINTNISSLIAQRNLNDATSALNLSIERMTTGFTINHARDNAAGYSISNLWETQLGSLDVATNNAATGLDMLSTAEESYGLLTEHLQRVRDLTAQASNGTYGSTSLKAIQAEIEARLQEISRIASNSEFNGIKLLSYTGEAGDKSGITAGGVNLQVGIYADANSRINLAKELFSNATVSGLFKNLLSNPKSESGKSLTQLLTAAYDGFAANAINNPEGIKAISAACAGLIYDGTKYTLQNDSLCGAKEMLSFLDLAIEDISSRVTAIGAAQNRVTSAIDALDVQATNLTSSLSTLRDTDIAKESSDYIQAQILQQASATLLSTANQLPSIALNLI